jgi:hypothetical protein
MKRSFIVLFPLAFALAFALCAQQTMPRMTAVEPANGKVGDVLAAAGENLDKDQVKEVYLTAGSTDLKVEITEQAAAGIKFKIPAKTAAGRYSLMILTAGKEPKLIEQPVKITVE